ncbi:MAG TPA: hypothetical protein VF669_19040 [Tepidisphaeraceae bacterium]|jgi:hypothetical protein
MESANVSSIDALRSFRAALIKFAESANYAITDADADVRGTLIWLERDQSVYWKNQIRKRHEALERAREALRHKELYKAPHGGRASVVDEQKMVAKCKAALAEAEQKLANVKKSILRLTKAQSEFIGQIQRLGTAVQSDLPAAIADLDRMVRLLDEYVSLRAPTATISAPEESNAAMTRATEAPTEEERDWATLRQITPSPAERAAVAPGLIFFGTWKSGTVKPAQLDAIKLLNLEESPVDVSQRVVLHREVSAAEHVYVERLAPAFPGDSGFFIGSADAAPGDEPKLLSLSAGEVLEMREDFAALLKLPQGTLVGFDHDGIAALLDDHDQNLWPSVRPAAATVENPQAQEE